MKCNCVQFDYAFRKHLYEFDLIARFSIISDFVDVARYRPTQRGSFKLVHDFYEYYKTDKQLEGAQAWRCVYFNGLRGEKCIVRAYTKNCGMVDRVRINGTHNHPPTCKRKMNKKHSKK